MRTKQGARTLREDHSRSKSTHCTPWASSKSTVAAQTGLSVGNQNAVVKSACGQISDRPAQTAALRRQTGRSVGPAADQRHGQIMPDVFVDQPVQSDLTTITTPTQESEVSSFRSASSDFEEHSPSLGRLEESGVQTPESSVEHVKHGSWERKTSTASLRSGKGKPHRAVSFRDAASAFKLWTGHSAPAPDPPNTTRQPAQLVDSRNTISSPVKHSTPPLPDSRVSWYRKSPSSAAVPPSPPPDRPLPPLPKRTSSSSHTIPPKEKFLKAHPPGSQASRRNMQTEEPKTSDMPADGFASAAEGGLKMCVANLS